MNTILQLAHRSNYGEQRCTSIIQFIVVHYTGNDGDKAENNARYFSNTPNLGRSAHYFVDDVNIYQSVPDDYIAYSVGGERYKDCLKTGGAKLYNIATNKNTLNIEICDTTKNGTIYPTERAIENAISLVREKMAQYHIGLDGVIRHFDVTGKYCPAYWSVTPENNSRWYTEFKNKLVHGSDMFVDCQYRIKTLNRCWTEPVASGISVSNCNDAITDISIAVSSGVVKYRVHVLGGDWLPWVTGYDINNYVDGYAGIGKMIDAIQVLPSIGTARYAVGYLDREYYPYQYDTDVTAGQDGYAGVIGLPFTKFKMEII